MRNALLLILTIAMTGCFKKDVPVDPYPRGDAIEAVIEMGQGYNNQVFYSFGENKIVKTVRRVDWDIAFSCAPGSNTVRVNSSRGMYAAIANDRSFASISDTSGLEFKWDASSGNPDTLAIKLTSDTGQFVLNLGYGENFEILGFKKISFRFRNDTLRFNWSNLDNTGQGSGTITKDTIYNYQHFSLLNEQAISIEPPKKDYDIFFSQYIYYFEELDVPYLVSGVLLNPYNTLATRYKGMNFEEYSASDLDPSDLSNKADIIGYDWKWYDLDLGIYTVDVNSIYVIRSSEGFLYKMHFVDYYNNQGIIGYPRMQQQKI